MLFPQRQRYPTSRPRDRSLFTTGKRNWRRLLLLVFSLYVFSIYSQRKHPFTQHAHQIGGSGIEFEKMQQLTEVAGGNNNNAPGKSMLPLDQATEFCAAHRWAAYPRSARRRRVYDMVMLNNELDWLEMRLRTMGGQVDYFVVLESRVTFTGLAKKLVFADALREEKRFQAWKDRIIYVVVEGMPVNAPRTWDLEDHQRNAMLLQGVLGQPAASEKMVEEGDLLIVADVDELVRPAALLVLRECNVPDRVTLRSKFYYYGFQWLHKGEEWAHPQATVYRGTSTILPADLRNGEGGNRVKGWWDKADLWNAGWHCSSCFSTVDDMLNKMKSFSHTSLNHEEYRNKTRIVNYIRKGLDLWDRPTETYARVEQNEDIPEFLKTPESRKRFGYLLDRDGPNAGFTDYKEGD